MISNSALEAISLMENGAYSADAREVKTHVLYDTWFFNTTITDRTYFVIPVSAAGWEGATLKTYNETNMEDAGKLPNGQAMVITHMGIQCILPLAAEDTGIATYARNFANIINSSVFELSIANKAPEIQVHGSEFFPRPFYLPGMQDTATDANAIFQTGEPTGFGWHSLDPLPVSIGDGESFSVTQKIRQPDASVKTILDADASALNGVYGRLQVRLAGVTTHKK